MGRRAVSGVGAAGRFVVSAPGETGSIASSGLRVVGASAQPSGVFASIYAQDLGCRYLRAS
jgi:hypothetical protein